MKQTLAFVCAIYAVTSAQSFAQDTAPMSAIDWLSDSVAESEAPDTTSDEPPVSTGASSPNVTVTPLGETNTLLVGLLPSTVTGLPRDLWSYSDPATLIALTQAEAMPTLPALQDLMTTLMMAEVDAPITGSTYDRLFLARVDKLLDFGALEQAQAMLAHAEPESPALFRRWFDIGLLNGSEATACDHMQARPSVAPTYPARIFCLARAGDWTVAALTLNTHRVLGDVTDEEEQLLSRFLDPDLYEDEPPLAAPERISPLVFRMREAIGEGLTTQELPLAFAHADLRPTTGWKARLEAAERLARAGVLDPNTLQDLYTSRTPSASGGVWERVKAFQRFDNALQNQDSAAIAQALRPAWNAMIEIRAEVSFAALYADQLTNFDGLDTGLVSKITLLSKSYATVTQEPDAFITAIAQGDIPKDPRGLQQRAVTRAFVDPVVPPAFAALLEQGKMGEALLRAIATFNAGLNGDPQSVTDALSTFQSAGLEDLARRVALEYLLLDRAL